MANQLPNIFPLGVANVSHTLTAVPAARSRHFRPGGAAASRTLPQHITSVVLRPGLDGRFESVKQVTSARYYSIRRLGGLADDDKRCPVF